MANGGVSPELSRMRHALKELTQDGQLRIVFNWSCINLVADCNGGHIILVPACLVSSAVKIHLRLGIAVMDLRTVSLCVFWLLQLADTEVLDLKLKLDPVFPLAIDATLEHTPGDVVQFRYTRSDAVGDVLAMNVTTNAGSSTTTVKLLRLHPNKEYTVQVDTLTRWGQTGRNPFAAKIKTGGSGVPELDDAPVATVTGKPSWEVVMVSHLVQNDPQRPYLVAFDKTGWMVWYLEGGSSAGSGSVWDQIPDTGNIVVLQTGVYRYWTKHSSEFTPSKRLVSRAEPTCSLADGATTLLHHEARIDRVEPTQPVLSFMSSVKNLTGFTNPQMADVLVKWDRNQGTVQPLYNMFDYFDVNKVRGVLSNETKQAVCTTTPLYACDDWTHANAASRYGDSYVVSLRHLSAIASFTATGTPKLEWVFSSEITSDFSFENDTDKFYNQHHGVRLDENLGRITMWDNGYKRPGTEKFSRALEFELDFTTKKAKLVWEFRPGVYNYHAGSLSRLRNGNRLAAASCDNEKMGSDWKACTHKLWEVTGKQDSVATAIVKRANTGELTSYIPSSGYRAIPYNSIGGEISSDGYPVRLRASSQTPTAPSTPPAPATPSTRSAGDDDSNSEDDDTMDKSLALGLIIGLGALAAIFCLVWLVTCMKCRTATMKAKGTLPPAAGSNYNTQFGQPMNNTNAAANHHNMSSHDQTPDPNTQYYNSNAAPQTENYNEGYYTDNNNPAAYQYADGNATYYGQNPLGTSGGPTTGASYDNQQGQAQGATAYPNTSAGYGTTGYNNYGNDYSGGGAQQGGSYGGYNNQQQNYGNYGY
eukprot:TRINITY_DN4352_c0_g1_i1.p1 TRINITY_DN4352_c0_g1~~TRINITY_DN4352_c0_g1_i1.p1  ORF type:complete len:815 (+),score=93.61 TRINITY_DN4352_c0_g1_i1:621-3065(+)